MPAIFFSDVDKKGAVKTTPNTISRRTKTGQNCEGKLKSFIRQTIILRRDPAKTNNSKYSPINARSYKKNLFPSSSPLAGEEAEVRGLEQCEQQVERRFG
jgi:hypothetical protein